MVLSITWGVTSSFEHFLDEVQAEKCSLEQFWSMIPIVREVERVAGFRRSWGRRLAESFNFTRVDESETHCRAMHMAYSGEIASE